MKRTIMTAGLATVVATASLVAVPAGTTSAAAVPGSAASSITAAPQAPAKAAKKVKKFKVKKTRNARLKDDRTIEPRVKRSSPKYAKIYAKQFMKRHYGWGKKQYRDLRFLWTKESRWQYRAHNGSSGAYGIPQSLPGHKMASAGKDWRTNPRTQVRWGLDYIKMRYGKPSGAVAHFRARNWY